MGVKNTEFFSDFRLSEGISKNKTLDKVRQNKLFFWTIFVHFFWEVLSYLKSALNSGYFDTHMDRFWEEKIAPGRDRDFM